jgi:hypothetical protein
MTAAAPRRAVGPLALRVAGTSCGLRLRRANTFALRLVGFWPGSSWHAVDVIEFPRCSAVHTFGMSEPIDVVFVDAAGRVLRVISRLPPWRFVRECEAYGVFEFRAGLAAPLGIDPGVLIESEAAAAARDGSLFDSVEDAAASQRERGGAAARGAPGQRRHGQSGSSMIEFSLALILVVLPIVSGILEFAQLATSRQLLGFATSEAARTAAITTMDAESANARVAGAEPPGEASIRLSLARGLLPLLGGDYATATGTVEGMERWRIAVLETMRPDRVQWVLEPAVLSSPDLVVGRLNVTYCRELFFPPTSYLLPELMKLWTDEPFARLCLEAGRVPITAGAVVSRSRYP